MLTKIVAGTEHRKSSFSGAQGNCAYVARDLASVHDSKSGRDLRVNVAALVAFVK